MEPITIVKWNKPNVLTVYFKPEKAELTDNSTNVGLKLLPGNNKAETKVWEEAKKSKIIGMYLSSGDIEEFNLKKDLNSLNEKQAKSIIKTTFDKHMLLEWKESEKRALIVASLDKQIMYIDAQAKKKKEEEKDVDDDE